MHAGSPLTREQRISLTKWVGTAMLLVGTIGLDWFPDVAREGTLALRMSGDALWLIASMFAPRDWALVALSVAFLAVDGSAFISIIAGGIST